MEDKVQYCGESLYLDHYVNTGHWEDLDVERLAKYFRLKVSQIIAIMEHVERQHKQSKRKWRNIKFTKPCRTCGVKIGFAETESDKLMPVNLNDFSTHWACEKPGKAKAK